MYYYEWIVQNVPSVDVIKWSINFGKLLSTVFYTVDGQKYVSAGMIELSTVFFLIFVKDNWVKIQRGHKINTKWYHTQEAECESDYRENQWGCSIYRHHYFCMAEREWWKVVPTPLHNETHVHLETNLQGCRSSIQQQFKKGRSAYSVMDYSRKKLLTPMTQGTSFLSPTLLPPRIPKLLESHFPPGFTSSKTTPPSPLSPIRVPYKVRYCNFNVNSM